MYSDEGKKLFTATALISSTAQSRVRRVSVLFLRSPLELVNHRVGKFIFLLDPGTSNISPPRLDIKNARSRRKKMRNRKAPSIIILLTSDCVPIRAALVDKHWHFDCCIRRGRAGFIPAKPAALTSLIRRDNESTRRIPTGQIGLCVPDVREWRDKEKRPSLGCSPSFFPPLFLNERRKCEITTRSWFQGLGVGKNLPFDTLCNYSG